MEMTEACCSRILFFAVVVLPLCCPTNGVMAREPNSSCFVLSVPRVPGTRRMLPSTNAKMPMVNMVSGWMKYCKYSRPYNGKKFHCPRPLRPPALRADTSRLQPCQKKICKYLWKLLNNRNQTATSRLQKLLSNWVPVKIPTYVPDFKRGIDYWCIRRWSCCG